MARIHDTISISSGSQNISLGMLLGSRVSGEVFDSINSTGHSSFFDNEFAHMRNEFLNRYVRPMDALSNDLTRTVNMVMNPDRIRILDTVEDFRSIPPSMELAILMFEPVLQGFKEGRIEGFGYDINTLPEEDIHGRYIDNFTCEDVAEASDDDGYYDIKATFYSDDIDLSEDEVYAIRKTRDYIRNKLLPKTDRDPTNIDMMRG